MKTKTLLQLFVTGLILFTLLLDLSAQMKFKDLESHPVLTYGDEGEWDDGVVWIPKVIKDGDTLRMWYTGHDADIWSISNVGKIGYAWSLDGITWNKHHANPVIEAEYEWEGGKLYSCAVIKDEDMFKMWYGAEYRMSNTGYVVSPAKKIGYAESYDGINWTKHPDSVLGLGPASDWDDDFIVPYTVIKEGNEYKMWYYAGRYVFPGLLALPQIGLATSLDGIHWTKYDDPETQDAPYASSDPVMKLGQTGEWDSHRTFEPVVMKTDTGYFMFYSGLKGPINSSTKQQIGYAYSSNGIHWERVENNPYIKDDHSFVEWGHGITNGSALYYANRMHYWFSCSPPYWGARPQIGYAVQLIPCVPESFEFTTQAEIDSFMADCNNCNEIQGDVTICGADITDLSGLRFLTSIGGDAHFRNNDELTGLEGLDNLSSITGNLIIGGYWPFPNNALQSLSGLNNLTSVGGLMEIANNPLLKNLVGLESLTSIGGRLQIGNGDAKGNNTRHICSDSLQSLTGLENLVTIGGPLSLEWNSTLVSIAGLEQLDSIGGLWINGIPVKSLKELDNLSYIGDGGIMIRNTDLTSLNGLEGVTSIGGDLMFENNEFLCKCDMQSICNYLANPAGDIHIDDNVPGCNSQEEVEEDCNNSCMAEGITFYSQDDINNFSSIHPGCRDIEGNVRIIGDNITGLDSLHMITSIGGDLSISECPDLTDLTGLENLIFIGGRLIITWNKQLSVCDADGICRYLDIPSGNIIIHDNATGCNSQEEVWLECTVGVDESSVVSHQSLVWVYPNPTNGVSSFGFRVSGSEHVTLKIYDIHSRVVATVVDEVMPAGEHVVSFDAGSLTPGIYFCTLTTSRTISTLKILKSQ